MFSVSERPAGQSKYLSREELKPIHSVDNKPRLVTIWERKRKSQGQEQLAEGRSAIFVWLREQT